MVDQGQFLERMTVVAGPAGASLEALYHRGHRPGPAVVVAGHPALSGTMESAVATEVVWALARAGYATLRFNFRGVGASTGELALPARSPEELADAATRPGALRPLIDDLAAVLDHHRSAAPGLPHVVGYSFGAAVVASAALRDIRSRTLISPPVALWRLETAASMQSDADVRVICGGDDPFAPGERAREVFGRETLVRELPGADHSFQRGLGALGREVLAHVSPRDHRGREDDGLR